MRPSLPCIHNYIVWIFSIEISSHFWLNAVFSAESVKLFAFDHHEIPINIGLQVYSRRKIPVTICREIFPRLFLIDFICRHLRWCKHVPYNDCYVPRACAISEYFFLGVLMTYLNKQFYLSAACVVFGIEQSNKSSIYRHLLWIPNYPENNFINRSV